MQNNVTIRHLRAFCRVAQCGSFTRAADGLHLTQSTLTASIKQLEHQVGLTLLDRTTRRVLLTSEGERFLPVAERLLSDFDTAISDLQARSQQQQGQVGVAASPSVLTRLLPPVVREFRQRHGNIGLYLRDDGAGGIEQRVLDNEVDFGIAGNHSNQVDLHYRPLLRDRYGLVVPADHPLVAERSLLNWSELAGQPLLQLSSDTGIRAQLAAVEARREVALSLSRALIEVSNPAVLANMIKEGVGVSVLPALAASTEAFSGLRFIPLQQPLVERAIFLITRRGRALSPAADAMRALVMSRIPSLALPAFVVADSGA